LRLLHATYDNLLPVLELTPEMPQISPLLINAILTLILLNESQPGITPTHLCHQLQISPQLRPFSE